MTVICVLGSGRSGTSAVANLVRELGVYLGPEDHVQKPTAWNPEGCWEHLGLLQINLSIFERYGGTSLVPPAFPPGWHTSPDLAELRARARRIIADDFAGRPLWGWKDPTACLTLPFWQEVVGDARYVICVRNPVDVAASLRKQGVWPFDVAIDAWIERYLSAFLFTSGSPRLFFSFDDYFQSPREQIEQLATFIGQPLPDQGSPAHQRIFGTVRDGLRNFRSPVEQVLADSRLSDGDKYFYLLLRKACEAPESADDLLLMLIDQYRAAIRERSRAFRRSVAALHNEPGGLGGGAPSNSIETSEELNDTLMNLAPAGTAAAQRKR